MGRLRSASLLLLLLALLLSASGYSGWGSVQPRTSVIVQSQSTDAASAAVIDAGGTIVRRLEIINGVTATVSTGGLRRLQANPQLRISPDVTVYAAGRSPTMPPTMAHATGKETGTDGLLLYPAATTGAYLLRTPPVPSLNLRCQNQQVVDQGGTVNRELLGWGVTVAVIDSGFINLKNANQWNSYDAATRTLYAQNGEGRCIVYRDFLPVSAENGNLYANNNQVNSVDQNGHGTHIVSTIADGRQDLLAPGLPPMMVGVAPGVNLVLARVLNKNGAGTYGDVIAAIEWIIANRDVYRIRVLNLSLYAPVTGPYWSDPLNQAVMKAWQAGIVVVTAAGNDGPEPGTITVPGNVPYVITVGAVRSGRYNRSGADELALYSSRGPTESAFVKPDVVVPASRTIAPMPDESVLAVQLTTECTSKPASMVSQPCIAIKADVDFGIGAPSKKHTYFYLSGTSMAAAEVSGLVALLLQANPALTNDQVKGRLLSTARAAEDPVSQSLVYSPWEQGAGMVDLRGALVTPGTTPANQGMNVTLDLDTMTEPQMHYWGTTVWDETSGAFRLIDDSGATLAVWSGKSRIWAGNETIWSGKSRIWAGNETIWSGKSRIWAGGSSSWAASASLWAGKSRIWAGSTPATAPATAASGELPHTSESPCGQVPGCILLPLVTN